MVAKLPGEDVTQFTAPAGWRPRPMIVISIEDLKANYELVKVAHEGGGSVETYRHRLTGDLVYIGRADVVQAQTRYRELTKELAAIETMSQAERLEAAATFLTKAAQLVDDTGHREPGPLMLQGISARLLGRWDVAERAFRAVTTLQPTFLSAWHDLTWALASLGRLDEAESIARHAIALAPDDSGSLGNLADVLRERGKLDEALVVITRATELHPEDNINEVLLDRIRNDRRKKIDGRSLP
jgi:tetratricopeptide (TPR) repeat protein